MINKYTNKQRGLLAVIMAMVMVFAGAAFVAAEVDAADDITYISGTITPGADQEYTQGKVVINDDLTIPKDSTLTINGASFTVDAGATITIEAGGQLILQGDSLINVNGDIIANGIDGTDAAITSDVTNYSETVGFYVTGDITLNKGAKISGTSGKIVVLKDGSINVNSKNNNVSVIENQTILMADGVSFTLKGYAKNVTLGAYTGSDKYYQTSQITITSTDTDAKSISDFTVSVNVEKVIAFNVNDKKTVKNYVMDISGTIGKDAVILDAGTAYCEGDITSSGWFLPNEDGDAAGSEKLLSEFSVSSSLKVTAVGSLTINSNTFTEVSGSMTIIYDEDLYDSTASAYNGGQTTIKGDVLVTGNVDVNWKALADVTPANATNSGYIIIKGGTVIGKDYDASKWKSFVYGALYVVEDTDDETAYIMDLDVAIENAVAAGVEEVILYAGYTSGLSANVGDAYARDAYIVDKDIVIPNGITLTVNNAMIITEDATVTFEAGSEFAENDINDSNMNNSNDCPSIFVEGMLVDNDNVIPLDTDGLAEEIYYEVSKYNEDTNVMIFTTLAIALEDAVADDEITVVNSIIIDEDLTIPADVTVIAGGDVSIVDDAVLTIVGTLDVSRYNVITVDANSDVVGDINLKGMIIYDNTLSATIDGAYYGLEIDDELKEVISSVEIAAENSALIETGEITIKGKVNAGDLIFTTGDDVDLEVQVDANAVVKSGTITLIGAALDVDNTAELTATVTATISSGTSSITLAKVSGVDISIAEEDDGETVTTTLVVNGIGAGKMTISAGEVVAGTISIPAYSTDAEPTTVTVASGATLIVNDENSSSIINADMIDPSTNEIVDEAYAGLIIDGTLVAYKAIDNTGAILKVTGTMNVYGEQVYVGEITVTGNITVLDSEEDADNAKLTLNKLTLGNEPETLGAGASIVGNIVIATDKYIVAYPGVDLSGALINVDENGESQAYVTEYYINGILYMTTYAIGNVAVSNMIPAEISLTGFDKVTYDSANNKTWYTDAALSKALDVGDSAADVSAVYASATPLTANIQISVGTGMSVYVDGVKYSNGQVAKLDVGAHELVVMINPGYTGTTTAKFGGETVTDSFTISPEMAGKTVVLSVMGEISVDNNVVTEEPEDGGMTLVEILLIVLVVLVVILAVIVALRMMRS